MSKDRCPHCGEEGSLHAEIESALSRGALDESDRARLAAVARRGEEIEVKRSRGFLVLAALAAAVVLLVVAAKYVLEGGADSGAPPREKEAARSAARAPDLPPMPAEEPVPPKVPAPGGTKPPDSAAPGGAAPEPAKPTTPEAPPGAPAPIGVVSGRVETPDGRGIEGAKVTSGSLGGPGHFEVKSDASGEFRFEGVPEGRWFAEASAPSCVPRRLMDIVVKPEAGLGDLRVVLAGEGAAGTGAIEGTVLDRDGRPVAGAKVAVRGLAAAGTAGTETDAEGRFRIAPLLPGSYTVEIEGPSTRTRFVTVTPGKATRVDFAGSASLTGIVLDAGGNPMPGVIVRISPLDDEGRPRGGRYAPNQVETGPDGRFSIPNAGEGPHRVEVQSLEKGNSFAVALDPIRLTGQDQEVTLQLEESGIAGRITDAETREPPTERPHISLYRVKPWEYVAAAFLNADGSYRFRSVPAGTYRIYVYVNGYRQAQRDLDLGDGELKSGVDFELVKLVPGTVIFKVTDSAGAPVEGLYSWCHG